MGEIADIDVYALFAAAPRDGDVGKADHFRAAFDSESIAISGTDAAIVEFDVTRLPHDIDPVFTVTALGVDDAIAEREPFAMGDLYHVIPLTGIIGGEQFVSNGAVGLVAERLEITVGF